MNEYEHYLNLCELVKYHNGLYYKDGKPEITDADYDKLYKEIEELEAANPQWVTEDSPTQYVGNDLNSGFKKINHEVRMESINDIFEQREDQFEELRNFIKGIGSRKVGVEPKLDGCAVTLKYQNNALVYAATRGNGKVGDDITENALQIPSIPKYLEAKNIDIEDIEIRGEIYMTESDFAILNKEREEQGLSQFANPRNATAGSIKLLDSKEVGKRHLQFRAHGIVNCSWPINTMDDYERILNDLGVPYCSPITYCDTITQVQDAVMNIKKMKDNGELEYPIDGAVIKVYNYDIREEMGSTARAPRWAAAFKYLPEQSATVLRDIILQVGRTGVITPVAVVDPVRLSGTTVTRATLHNQDEITRKDIRIGDTVIMEKSGEIIPAIVRVDKDKRPENTVPYSIYKVTDGKCPVCGSPIEQEEGMVAYRCTNPMCQAKLAMRILYMCKRDCLNIDNLGESIAQALVDCRMVDNPWDIFLFEKEQWEELNLGDYNNVRLLGEKRAAKIYDALEAAKKLPLHRWLTSLGIRNIGTVTAKKLCDSIKDLNEIATMDFHYFWSKCSSNGVVVFNSFKDFFTSKLGLDFLDLMKTIGVNPKSEHIEINFSSPFALKTVVITGTLSQPRKYYEKLITENGGRVSSSVSKWTNYLLAGENCGSKLDKAKKLGVTIIDEERFMKMIGK